MDRYYIYHQPGQNITPNSEKSTIQTNVEESMSKSLEAHILLMKLASFQFSPFYCGESLSNLYSLKNPLNANSSHKEFFEVFFILSTN